MERPWLLRLSYVKPHWPDVDTAPWHALYRGDDDVERCTDTHRRHGIRIGVW